jgi:phospholipid/cholesterol/gamma-HCH transport system substrate-binding protein
MKRRDEIIVGLFTILAIAVLVASMLWLARGGLTRGYPLYARFEWGAGLKQGQPVLFSGANIGYVDDVHLLENGGLIVVMRIYKHQRVPEGTVATIAPYGIFGDQLIALKATMGPTGRFIAAGDTLTSGPPAVQLADVIGRVDTIARGLNTLIASLNNELVGEKAIATVRHAAVSADSMIRTITRLATEQSKELTRTQETLRRVVTAVDSAKIGATLDGFRDATTHVTTLIDGFQATNQRLSAILTKIDSGNGSAAKLLNDPRMEQDIRALLVRMDSLFADFKANPRKYIKLSIF